MSSVIKQTIVGSGDSQTIKMVVKANERGPRGLQGERGPRGLQGIQGPRGFDGAIQYRAGTGINITDDYVIQATGGSIAEWGGLQGNIQDQTDLQQEFGEYTKTEDLATVATSGDYDDLSNKPTIPTVNNATLTIQSDGTTVGTFTANSGTNVTANVIPPVRVGSVISTPTDVAFVDTVNIVDHAVTAAKLDFSSLNFGNYSTTEQSTGFTWIDGKTIYKKTVNFGALPNNTSKTVNHGISNLGAVINIEGIATDGSRYIMLPLVYRSTDTVYDTECSVTSTAINCNNSGDRSGYSAYVTIYYTKTS